MSTGRVLATRPLKPALREIDKRRTSRLGRMGTQDEVRNASSGFSLVNRDEQHRALSLTSHVLGDAAVKESIHP